MLKRPLKLLLKTPSNDPVSDVGAALDKCWSDDGKWAGGDLGGWDGGASNGGGTTGQRSPAADLAFVQRTSTTAGPTSPPLAPMPVPHQFSTSTQMTIGDVNVIPTDIERTGRGAQRQRSVTFALPSKALTTQSRGDAPSAPERPLHTQLSPYDRFWKAVNELTCKDLIAALQDGASQDSHVIASGLREGYEAIKVMLDRVETDIGFTPTSGKLLQLRSDLIDKKRVLSIYRNGIMLLDKALNLQHWACYELRIIDADFRPTDDTLRALPANARVSATITTAVKGEMKSPEKLVSTISRTYENARNTPKY
jgi:hypothetical protein